MSTPSATGMAYSISAIQWDFQYRAAKLGHHLNGYTHEDDKIDLYLTKENVDMDALAHHAIFNVGGYFHYHESDGKGIYLKEGYRSVKRLGTPHIGIMNFMDVNGVVSAQRIAPADIHAPNKVQELHEVVYLTIPDLDPKASLVGLVLCGELYWVGHDGEIAKFVSSNCVKINLNSWGLLRKVFHLKGLFGEVENMGLVPYKDGRISTEEVKRPEFIRSLFTLPQTFIVSVTSDKPLHLEYWDVASHQLPWKYECKSHQHQPLRLSDGRYPPCLTQTHENGMVLITDENRVYPQMNDTIDRDLQPYLVETNISSRRGIMRHAKFAYIYREGERPKSLTEWEGDNRTYEDLLLKDAGALTPEQQRETEVRLPDTEVRMSHNIHVCGSGWYYQDEGSVCVEAKHLYNPDTGMFNTGDFLELTPSEQLSYIEGMHLDGLPYQHGPRFYVWDNQKGFIPEEGNVNIANLTGH